MRTCFIEQLGAYENRYVGTTDRPPADDADWWAVDLWMSEEWCANERRVRDGMAVQRVRSVRLRPKKPCKQGSASGETRTPTPCGTGT